MRFQANPSSIVIVEDQSLMREALAKASKELGYDVVGCGGSGMEAIELVAQHKPAIVLLDIGLPDIDGFEVVATTRRQGHRPLILVVSSHCDANTVHRVEQFGLNGYLDKRVSIISDLEKALFCLEQGIRYYSETFLQKRREVRNAPLPFDKTLSAHQQKILTLLGDLLSDEEIAEKIRVSGETIEKHRFRILRQLGLKNRLDLVRYARLNGFVTLK